MLAAHKDKQRMELRAARQRVSFSTTRTRDAAARGADLAPLYC
ncbi:MAG TPA: hypothetical protein VNA89_00360 [Gemmatimonadaceae bacterium]|nr:hypothetical protein [Gemmatimonadaceae bacterium]